jgi:hypothetical protein
LAVSVSSGLACDQHTQAADANDTTDAKDAKTLAVNGSAKGCDMPCCAHANAAANDTNAANETGEKPCAAHDAKGCPKKAGTTGATAAKTKPAEDTAKAEPAADPGTNR